MVGAFGQNASDLSVPAIHRSNVTLKGGNFASQLHRNTSNLRTTGQTGVLLNYDSADATIWGAAAYFHNQGELMNAHYTYPADTVGKNFNCINSISVAFDSMIDPYVPMTYTVASKIRIDTIYIPIAQFNHSGINDTLDVQINSCSAKGYPQAAVLLDQKVIGTTGIGGASTLNINFLKVPFNQTITATKFAVTLVYSGSKVDSCYFIYGFGYFKGSCPGPGVTLANTTNFRPIATTAGTGQFNANSFEVWNQYKSFGTLPDATGANIYYDCNGNGKYDPGVDGTSYYQNINIIAMVDLDPSGIDEVAANQFSVGQNYPNPFNKTTQITYNVTKSSDVVFSVYDMTGRELVNNTYTTVAPGQHVISLAANQFTPGVYFYTFNVNGVKATKKMVITQ